MRRPRSIPKLVCLCSVTIAIGAVACGGSASGPEARFVDRTDGLRTEMPWPSDAYRIEGRVKLAPLPLSGGDGVLAMQAAIETMDGFGTTTSAFFPVSELGKAVKLLDMVKTGELDLFQGGPGIFSAMEKRFNVFDIHYLFSSTAQASSTQHVPQHPARGRDRLRRCSRMLRLPADRWQNAAVRAEVRLAGGSIHASWAGAMSPAETQIAAASRCRWELLSICESPKSDLLPRIADHSAAPALAAAYWLSIAAPHRSHDSAHRTWSSPAAVKCASRKYTDYVEKDSSRDL